MSHLFYTIDTMITVSYNVISLNEVRKINNNNNRAVYDPPIVIGHNIIIHNKEKMNEIMSLNIATENMKFVVNVFYELRPDDISKEIVGQAIEKLTELGLRNSYISTT